jgi:hypothetical protein
MMSTTYDLNGYRGSSRMMSTTYDLNGYRGSSRMMSTKFENMINATDCMRRNQPAAPVHQQDGVATENNSGSMRSPYVPEQNGVGSKEHFVHNQLVVRNSGVSTGAVT